MNLLGRYRTEDSRLSAMTTVVVLVGIALGLGAVRLWAEPIDVTPVTDGYRMSLCTQMYRRGSVDLVGMTNHGNSPVEITSIRPSTSSSGLRVTGYVTGGDFLSTKIGSGAQVLPRVPHPHSVLAHRTQDLLAMVTGPANSHTDGFDVTLRNGSAVATRHIDVEMAFNYVACPNK